MRKVKRSVKAVRGTRSKKGKMDKAKQLREKVTQLRQMLAIKTQAFKAQLKNIEASSLQKAAQQVLKTLTHKAVAKIKALEKAEDAFEKMYAKKMRKAMSIFSFGDKPKEKTKVTRRRRRRSKK